MGKRKSADRTRDVFDGEKASAKENKVTPKLTSNTYGQKGKPAYSATRHLSVLYFSTSFSNELTGIWKERKRKELTAVVAAEEKKGK